MGFTLDDYWRKIRETGDENALENIFKETYASLCFYAFQITADRFLSEEIVQDVITNLWENRKRILIKGNFRAYLFRSVRNQALNVVIQNKTLKNSVNNIVSLDFWKSLENNQVFDAFLMEKLEAEDTEKVIGKAIEGLPAQCREVFKLSRFGYRTNEEISQLLNISVHTVRAQIFRAIEKIKEALEKNNENF